MIPNPKLRVLSTVQRAQVKALLMGGQACVVYGAAEFSRDTDFVLLAEPDNLGRFTSALAELQAERIAVPEFKAEHLERAAVHGRSLRQPASISSRLRPFVSGTRPNTKTSATRLNAA